MADKELKIKITGDASQLGAESKKAVDAFNGIRASATSMLAAFTGGLIGGGIAGGIQAAVGLIGQRLREARELLEDADRLNVDAGTAQAVKNISTATGGLPIAEAIQSARRARSEALAGDPEYVRAFERLGIVLGNIADMDPATLFYQIVNAAEQFDPAAHNAREQFAALTRLLGSRDLAGDITQFALGGLFRDQRLFSESGDIFAGLVGRSTEARAQLKKDFELPGQFGLGDENRAARIRQDNDQRELAIKRSTLSVEQQIAAVTAERAALEAQMASETDVVKRERLRSDILNLEAERVRLGQSDASAGRQQPLQSISVPSDEFAQRGLFIGGQQQVPGILQRQLEEARNVVREVRELRSDMTKLL